MGSKNKKYIVKRKTYDSAIALAEEYKVSITTVKTWIKKRLTKTGDAIRVVTTIN